MARSTPEFQTEIELPSAEALLAGTLALMTGFDDPQAEATHRGALHRSMMARKISANLDLLASHPLLSPNFQTLVWGLGQRWRGICAQLGGGGGAAGWVGASPPLLQ